MNQFQENYIQNEPLARHTSWKVGGPADIFFSPDTRSELSDFLGSNEFLNAAASQQQQGSLCSIITMDAVVY